MNRAFRLTALVAVLGSLALAPGALADQRFAHPAGDDSSPACPRIDPCDVETAVEHPSVADGDEVIVLPGTHEIGTAPAAQLTVDNAINLHGQGQPRPVIRGGGDARLLSVQAAATVSDLFLFSDTSRVTFGFSRKPITAERLSVTNVGPAACLTPLRAGAVLRDSVCQGIGVGAAGVALQVTGDLSIRAELVNVTAIGTNGGDGIEVITEGGSDATVNATNVVARAGGMGGTDVVAETDDSSSTSAVVNLDHSNFATVSETNMEAAVTDPGTGTGNQTAAPRFAGPFDFHQLGGSPTVNRGTAGDPLLGSLDFEGEPRFRGSAPDIGADEFPSPPLPSPPPGASTASPLPSNAFEVDRVERNKKKGTATIFVILPGPGQVGLDGKGLREIEIEGASAARATDGGEVELKVSPAKKGKQARRLRDRLARKGKAQVKAEITFVPTGGTPNSETEKLKLIDR